MLVSDWELPKGVTSLGILVWALLLLDAGCAAPLPTFAAPSNPRPAPSSATPPHSVCSLLAAGTSAAPCCAAACAVSADARGASLLQEDEGGSDVTSLASADCAESSTAASTLAWVASECAEEEGCADDAGPAEVHVEPCPEPEGPLFGSDTSTSP